MLRSSSYETKARALVLGFLENSGFYPDFILWLKTGDAQRIVFVDPHGMLHEDAPEHSDKIGLYKKLRRLSEEMHERSASNNVTLDSYIVSATPYEILQKRWSGNWDRSDFADEHILFPEGGNDCSYLTEMLNGQTVNLGGQS